MSRNPITRWIQKQAQPLVNDAFRKGAESGFLEAWQAHDVFDTGTADTLPLDPHDERRAYERLPLFESAVDTVVSLTLGTGVTYGELDDPRAMQALEEWYALNDVENFSKTIFTQWLLDGELLLLIAQDASNTEPAWLNLWDTRERPVTIRTAPGNPRLVTGIQLASNRRVEPDAFVWRANKALFNKTRGRSPMRTAVEAAENYTRLSDLRMRAHEIRGRLNAIYYALAETVAELKTKASRFLRVPRNGNVITLQMDPRTGQSEKLEFTNPNTAAADADNDTRTLIRTVAMVAGLPEHYLSVGDTGNRATAESMAEPMLRRIEEHQTFLEGVLTAAFRKELVRRYGDVAFTVRTSELNRDGTRVDGTIQVPASDLSIPFSFPPVRSDDSADLDRVRFAYDAGLLSRESTIEALGFDPALELERKANDPASSPGGDVNEPDPE